MKIQTSNLAQTLIISIAGKQSYKKKQVLLKMPQVWGSPEDQPKLQC